MTRQREAQFQTNLLRRIRAETDYVVKKVGTNGWPDYLLISRFGIYVWLELKREGEKLEPKQSEIMRMLIDLENTTATVCSPSHGVTLMSWLHQQRHRSYGMAPVTTLDPRNPKWRNDPPTLPASAVSKRDSARSAPSRGRSASRRRSSADE